VKATAAAKSKYCKQQVNNQPQVSDRNAGGNSLAVQWRCCVLAGSDLAPVMASGEKKMKKASINRQRQQQQKCQQREVTVIGFHLSGGATSHTQ